MKKHKFIDYDGGFEVSSLFTTKVKIINHTNQDSSFNSL